MTDADIAAIMRDFITLIVVIDSIRSIPVVLFAVQTVPPRLHRRFALRAIAIAATVLLAVLVGGQFVMEALGLRLGSFQVAGGVVLFIFAMTMIFGDSKAATEIEKAERDHLSGAVFPPAMRSIASPGAMLAIVILTDNDTTPIRQQAVTAALLIAVLLITLDLLVMASRIHQLIGSTGASVISRVMGILLATIAVDATPQGLDTLGILEMKGTGALSADRSSGRPAPRQTITARSARQIAGTAICAGRSRAK